MFCFPVVIMHSNSPISASAVKKTGYIQLQPRNFFGTVSH